MGTNDMEGRGFEAGREMESELLPSEQSKKIGPNRPLDIIADLPKTMLSVKSGGQDCTEKLALEPSHMAKVRADLANPDPRTRRAAVDALQRAAVDALQKRLTEKVDFRTHTKCRPITFCVNLSHIHVRCN